MSLAAAADPLAGVSELVGPHSAIWRVEPYWDIVLGSVSERSESVGRNYLTNFPQALQSSKSMPELLTGPYCHPAARTSQLEDFMGGTTREYRMRTSPAHLVKKETTFESASPDAQGCYVDRGVIDAEIGNTESMFQAQSPKKSRAKESSKHFGVRFRPDLQKWVAEIRVAEWKTVDKKVWLGTFDSEEGAARAVDAARKLLKCIKKRAPNFPCESLNAYSEKIPANLNLTNLGDETMFKDVTVFVKRKAQEYAASFCPNKMACISVSPDHRMLAQYVNSMMTPSQEDDSPASYASSYESSYNTHTGRLVVGNGQWMMSPPTSVACTSSAGTSPDSDHKSSFYNLDNNSSYNLYHQPAEMTQIELQSIEGDWTTVQLQPASHDWDPAQQYVLTDHSDSWILADDFFFPNDKELFQDQTDMDIDVANAIFVDSQTQAYNIGDQLLADWNTGAPLPQTTINSSYLMPSMDFGTTQVC